nr:hypothetical protein CFP56_72940 [Quercus suber]
MDWIGPGAFLEIGSEDEGQVVIPLSLYRSTESLTDFTGSEDDPEGYFYATADKLLTPTNEMQFWVWPAKAIPLIQ